VLAEHREVVAAEEEVVSHSTSHCLLKPLPANDLAPRWQPGLLSHGLCAGRARRRHGYLSTTTYSGVLSQASIRTCALKL